MEFTTPGAALRHASAHECVQIPGTPNALSARLIEHHGFQAMYLSSEAFSASELALPDVGILTLTELVEHAKRMTAATNIPLVVDAGAGFGGVANVERTIFELEFSGAAAIQLGDQDHPTQGDHSADKALVSSATMCAKLRAADAARADPATIIIAHVNACSAEGFDAAVARAKQYLDVGADWILPDALETESEFAQFAEAVEAPLIANMTEFGDSPLLNAQALGEMGYAAVLYPMTLMRVAMRATEAALAMLAGEGHQRDLLDLMPTGEELSDLLDYQEFQQRERAYFQPGGKE